MAQWCKAPSVIFVDGTPFAACINTFSWPCFDLDAVFWLAVFCVQTAVVVDVFSVLFYKFAVAKNNVILVKRFGHNFSSTHSRIDYLARIGFRIYLSSHFSKVKFCEVTILELH